MAAVVSAAGRYGARPTGAGRRTITIALVVGVHALLAWLLLAAPPRFDATHRATALSMFDVIVPPPPAPLPPPPPPPEIQPAARARSGGGSSGRAPRPSPAPRPPGTAAPMDATLIPEQPPMPLDLIDLGQVERDEDTGGGGTGAASGSGTGVGDGIGGGAGDGAGGGVGGRWQRVDWIQQPRPDQWRAVWPRAALRGRRGGTVLLVCMVPRPGPPRRCFLYSESPAGAGFGDAALALSRLGTFRVRPVRTPDGRWSKIPVLVPLIFKAADRPQKPTSAAAAPPAPPQP